MARLDKKGGGKMSIYPDGALILNKADKIRENLVLIEAAARAGDRRATGNCLHVAVDLVRQAERILAIVRRYQNG